MTPPTFENFSPYHLSWMIYRELIPYPTTLGMLSGIEPDEITKELGEQLRQWGVVDSTDQLTPDARNLFQGLYEYDFAYWGVLLLHNERQPFQIEMDQELIDIGLGRSIPDTPRVHWQVSYSGGIITVAMRAGDNVTLNQVKTSPENLDVSLTSAILSVINPLKVWPPAQFTTVKVPFEAVEKVPAYDSAGRIFDKATSARMMKVELARNGVDHNTISRFTQLIEAEKLAETEVLCTTSRGTSSSFFTVEFVHRVGMVLSHVGSDIEGNPVIVQEGASERALASELRKLRELPRR